MSPGVPSPAGALSRVYGVDNAFLIGGIAALALIAVLSAAAPRCRRLAA